MYGYFFKLINLNSRSWDGPSTSYAYPSIQQATEVSTIAASTSVLNDPNKSIINYFYDELMLDNDSKIQKQYTKLLNTTPFSEQTNSYINSISELLQVILFSCISS